MSRFITNKTHRVDLGAGEWIDIRDKISYSDVEAFSSASTDKPSLDSVIVMLEKFVVGWHLMDDDGKDVEYTVDKLKALDLDTIKTIMENAIGHYVPEKKSSPASTLQS